jgi:hypothetical protein
MWIADTIATGKEESENGNSRYIGSSYLIATYTRTGASTCLCA